MWLLLAMMAAQTPTDGYYRLQATVPVAITVPARTVGDGDWLRVGDGRWQRVTAERTGEAITFRLNPADWGGGETILVVGKEKGIDLNDVTPPKISRLTVDGKRFQDAPQVDLGWRLATPERLVWQVEDRNPLDLNRLAVYVNGRRLTANDPGIEVKPTSNGRRATVTLRPAKTTGFQAQPETRLSLHVADSSPVGNTVERAAVLYLLAPPAPGKKVEARVDSCYPNYSPETLTDGVVMEPGVSTTTVTWASADTEEPHWAMLAFDEPRRVEGLELFWAHYQGDYATSQRYTIEYWDGKGWKRLAQTKDAKPTKSSVHTFKAVTTSAIRVWQPAGGGCAARPNLMWLTDIQIK